MSTAKIWRDLKVELTAEEWAAVSLACANEEQVLDGLKASMKDAVTKSKEDIATSEKKMRAMNEIIRTHKETRTVECFEKHDTFKFTVELYRMDTGEMVESRPMTASERHAATQPRLPGTELRDQGAFFGTDNPTPAQKRHFREAMKPAEGIGTSPSGGFGTPVLVKDDSSMDPKNWTTAKAEPGSMSPERLKEFTEQVGKLGGIAIKLDPVGIDAFAAAVAQREKEGVPDGYVSTISPSGTETIKRDVALENARKNEKREKAAFDNADKPKPKKMSGAARRKLKREAAERGE